MKSAELYGGRPCRPSPSVSPEWVWGFTILGVPFIGILILRGSNYFEVFGGSPTFVNPHHIANKCRVRGACPILSSHNKNTIPDGGLRKQGTPEIEPQIVAIPWNTDPNKVPLLRKPPKYCHCWELSAFVPKLFAAARILCCAMQRPCEEAMIETGECGTANETPGCAGP